MCGCSADRRLLLAAMLAFLCSSPAWAEPPETALSPDSQPAAEAPPEWVLTGDAKTRVEELEKRIEELRKAEKYAEAISLAEEVLTIRREHQTGWTNTTGEPAEWWEVGDARLVVDDLHHHTTLTADQRAKLEEARQLDIREQELYEQGKYAEVAELQSLLLRIRRSVLGDDHPDTLASMNNQGGLLRSMGKYDEALGYYQEALEGCRRVKGDDHPDTLSSINNVGLLFHSMGKLNEARGYFREALERKRRVLGNDHPNTLTSIGNMGLLFSSMGKYKEALGYYREEMEGCSRVLGGDHPRTLLSIGDMGSLLFSMGKYEEALGFGRRGLEGIRRVLGDDHPDTLISIDNMGGMLKLMGKYEEALGFFSEALEGKRRVLGDDHPDTLISINNMGVLLQSMGKYEQALYYYREDMESSRRVLGDDHPDTLVSIGNMGHLLESLGRYEEAMPYHCEVIEGRRLVLGDDHPHTLISINNMGGLLCSMGKYEEGLGYWRDVLDGLRRVLGDDHPDTLQSTNNLGALLKSMGKFEAALRYHSDALNGRRRVLGDDHPGTLQSMHNMGALLDSMGKHEEALGHCREALEGRRRVLGDDHPHTLLSIISVGVLADSMGKHEEAEPYLREALSLAERLRTQVIGEERSRAAYSGKLRLSGIAASFASLLVKTDRSAEAWSVAERGRGRALLDLLERDEHDVIEAARTRAEQSGDTEAIATLEAALKSEQEARADLTTAEARLGGTQKRRKRTEKRDGLSKEERIVKLAKLDQEIDEQKKAIKSKRRALTEAGTGVLLKLRGLFPDAQPMSIEQIRAGMKAGELALGYTWADEFILLLTTSAQGEAKGLLLAKTKDEVAELGELVRQARDAISKNSTTSSDAIALGNQLFDKLIPDAIRPQIETADRLIVLPDGPLHGLPFEVLASGDSDLLKSSLDGKQIVYASSATMYLNRRALARRKSHGTKPSALVLGNPIFNREPVPEPDYPKDGILLTLVASGSNADKAGLIRGDVLLSYGGTKLPNAAALGPAIAAVNKAVESKKRKPEEPVKIAFWRDGKTQQTTLSPGRMGVQPSPIAAAEGLRSMALTQRGVEQATAEMSATDRVRLFGGKLTPLPGTGREAKVISQLIASSGGKATLLLGEDATTVRLNEAASGKRYLHLATHGLTGNSERPYDASLALSQPKEVSPDDIGFLRLGDLIRTWRGKLKKCDLVVLSACDTQRGVRKGTGIMALPWGFMYAGAPTVVASLWKVEDTATALLMIRFYENLLGKYGETRPLPDQLYSAGKPMTKADALREAKQWLRKLKAVQVKKLCKKYGLTKPSTLRGEPGSLHGPESTEYPFKHPCHWSSFVLLGDPG